MSLLSGIGDFKSLFKDELVRGRNPINSLDRFVQRISLEKFPQILKDAQYRALYCRNLKQDSASSVKISLLQFRDGLATGVESVISALGLGSFFKPSTSDHEADLKSHRIMVLLSLFTSITAIVFALAGLSTGGLIVGVIFLSIIVLSVIWPFIKPMPSILPNAENLTRKVQKGLVVRVQGRQDYLDRIAESLKRHRHVLLIGPSRIGKSVLAEAFAKAIDQGIYPEFGDKVVFRINTPSIVNQPSSFFDVEQGPLNKISLAMGRHRGNIILALDEVHMACGLHDEANLANRLKPFLDEHGNFPYVIASTTKEEYERLVAREQAFSKRFDIIEVNPIEREETLRVLRDTFLSCQHKPFIDADVFEYIYDKTRDQPQPLTARRLLERCIDLTTRVQKLRKQAGLSELLEREQQLISKLAVGEEVSVELETLEREKGALQVELAKENIQLDKLHRYQDLLERTDEELDKIALKTTTVFGRLFLTQRKKQRFLVLLELRKFLESYIKDFAKELGVRVVVDKALVDEVFAS